MKDEGTALDRYAAFGASTHSVDLLSIALSRTEEDLLYREPVAREVLKRSQSIRGLASLSASEIKETTGLTAFEAARFLATLELGRKISGAGKGEQDQLTAPDHVYALLSDLRDEKREHFVVLLLDSHAQLIRKVTVHIGTLTSSIVGAREVFREAIREGASSIIVAHNHPSGDPTPSPEDIEVTRELANAGQLLDIPLLDHVIIGENRWVSLRQRGIV